MKTSEISKIVSEYGLNRLSSIDDIVDSLLDYWLVSSDFVDKKFLASAVSKIAGYLSIM